MPEAVTELVALPHPAQPSVSFTTLAGGLHAAPALISHDGHQHGIQLRLTPPGARVLLGLPAGELAGHVVELGALLGPVAGELVDRLRSARTWTDRFAELDRVLERVAGQSRGHGDEPAPELGWAWRRLSAGHGRVGVGRWPGRSPTPSCAAPRAAASCHRRRRAGCAGTAGRGLRLPRFQRPRPGGQPVELRHLPGRLTAGR